MSLGANRLACSTTWVDSALWGSHDEASFCWALFSFPANGPATANTTTQNPRTTHLVTRPPGTPANRRSALLLPSRPGGSSPPATVRRAASPDLPNIPIVGSPITYRREACKLCTGELLDADEVAGGVAHGAVADPVGLVGWFL